MPGSVSYGTAQALSSLPGGGHHELLDDSFADSPVSLEAADFESTLDPSLAYGYGFGGISGGFVSQQQVGQNQQLSNLQPHTYENEASIPQTSVDPECLGDKASDNITDEELAKFLSEANGS